MEKSLQMAVNMLTKVLIQFIPIMQQDHEFGSLWESTFATLKLCMKSNHEELLESVPENTKNMLLVLSTQGILTREWQDGSNVLLWDMTWKLSKDISPRLAPEILNFSTTRDTEQLNNDDKTSEEAKNALSKTPEENPTDEAEAKADGQSSSNGETAEDEHEAPACKQS